MEMKILLYSIVFCLLCCVSLGQIETPNALKMKDGPILFKVLETIKWNDIYLALSYSEKYLGYGTNPAQLERINIDSIFWQHIFLPENKQPIIEHVVNPDWDKIYKRMVSIDIRDSVILCHGLFVIDRIFENYSDAHILSMTIQYDLKTAQSGLKIHRIQNPDLLTAFWYLFHTNQKPTGEKLMFHVSYRNAEDSSSFLIGSEGPFIPSDRNMSFAKNIDNENHLVYGPKRWSVSYSITPDSVVDIYCTGYEIVDANQKRVIFRSDSLYGIGSPLFMYQGKICLLAQLVDHATILKAFDVLDQKIISIADGVYLPLPDGFKWRNFYVIPKGYGIPITNELEALSFENEETRLVKVKF